MFRQNGRKRDTCRRRRFNFTPEILGPSPLGGNAGDFSPGVK